MPARTSTKRTARMTTATKRRAAIEKRQPAVTLITGGTGFLGSHLVRQLIEEGAKDVRVMATSIPDWLVDLGVETFAGSITNADDNKRAVEGISEIYHLAGKVSRERKDAREMYDIHVEGTRLLCDAAKAAGVKTIVLASTSGTIAVTKEGDTVPDETYPVPLDIISRWPYYASKAYQEMAALEHFAADIRSYAAGKETMANPVAVDSEVALIFRLVCVDLDAVRLHVLLSLMLKRRGTISGCGITRTNRGPRPVRRRGIPGISQAFHFYIIVLPHGSRFGHIEPEVSNSVTLIRYNNL